MSRDPITAKRATLIDQADDVVTALRRDTSAQPWLREAGLDGAAMVGRLATLAADARILVMVAEDADAASDDTHDADDLTGDVQRWQAVLRSAVRLAPPTAEAAVGELRGLVRGGGHRVTGALAMVRVVTPLLRRYADVLGPQVPTDLLIAEATALEVRLEALQCERQKASQAVAAASQAARDAVDALRAHLREMRVAWRVAARLSKGAVAPLDLRLAKGVVFAREARRARAAAAAVAASPDVDIAGSEPPDMGSSTDVEGCE